MSSKEGLEVTSVVVISLRLLSLRCGPVQLAVQATPHADDTVRLFNFLGS